MQHTLCEVWLPVCSLKHREVSQSNLQQYGYDEAKTRDEQIQGKLEVGGSEVKLPIHHAC